MINIGTDNFNLLIDEVNKFKYLDSEHDEKHNRICSPHEFENNINKENTIKYLQIDTNKFEVENDIDIIEYKEGSYLSEHTDGNTMIVMAILNDGFTGGNFVLEGEVTNFKSNGDVIYIKGTQLHHLEMIESGYRKIMILYLRYKSVF